MTPKNLLGLWLYNQHLTSTRFQTPAEVVAWFGAMQAQDYNGAKWAIGQRLPNENDDSIEKAFSEGKMLRTHAMRPTWHFVAPKDIRWMLMLTARRVKTVMASYNRKMGLTEKVFKKSNQIIAKALQGGKQLIRPEINEALHKAGIITKDNALAHIVMQAELDAIICSGPRRGKQFTYMLLDERAQHAKSLKHEEVLAELAKRYFQSHGPATVKDFVWWSGLTVGEAKAGIAMNNGYLSHEEIEGKTYVFTSSYKSVIPDTCYLLPNYDEYTIAYKERGAFFNHMDIKHVGTRGNAVFQHTIVIHGKIVGMWKRTFKKDSVIIDSQFFTKPTDSEYKTFKEAANRIGKFLNLSVILHI